MERFGGFGNSKECDSCKLRFYGSTQSPVLTKIQRHSVSQPPDRSLGFRFTSHAYELHLLSIPNLQQASVVMPKNLDCSRRDWKIKLYC